MDPLKIIRSMNGEVPMSSDLKFFHNGIMIQYQGTVTAEQLLQSQREVHQHVRERMLRFQLAVFDANANLDLSMDAARSMGTWSLNQARQSGLTHSALVAPSHGLRLTCLVWEVWGTGSCPAHPGLKTVMFDDLPRALSWLTDQGVVQEITCEQGPSRHGGSDEVRVLQYPPGPIALVG